MNESPDVSRAPAPAPSATTPSPENRLEALLIGLLLLGSLGLFFVLAWPLFQGRLYVEDDLAALYLPIRDFYAKCLTKGYNFLWMPHLANGFYIHGEGHGGFLHPLHFAFYRFFPLDRAFMLELLISYPVMWLGTYCFLRRWAVERSGALFGALLMTFIGCSMNHYVHISFVAVMAHLPWALLAIDVVMRAKRPPHAMLALAACILLSASQLYIGNPQVTYFSWLVEMGYALVLLLSTWRIGRLLHLGVGKALALAIGAAQLLPTLGVYQQSLRQDPGLDYQLGISLHPWNLLQMVSPYLFHGRVYAPLAGDEPWDAPYMGAAMVPLLLLLLMVAVRAWRSRTKDVPTTEKVKGDQRVLLIAGLVLAVFAALAVLGKYGFLYHVLTRIPVVNFFRAPARYVAVLHVALAVLGALSFASLFRIVRDQNSFSWKGLSPLFLVPLASIAVLVYVLVFRLTNEGDALALFDRHVMRTGAIALGAGLVCGATALVMLAARGKTMALVLLTLFCLVDVGLYSFRHKATESLPDLLAAIPLPPGDNSDRIEPDIVPYTMNRVALHGYRNVTGYLNLFPETYLDYAKPLPMQLAGVRWRASRLGTSPELHGAKEAGIPWIALENPLPRFRLLSEAVVSDEPMTALETIDLNTQAVVFAEVALDGGTPGKVDVRHDTPGYAELKTKTTGSQLLVFSENFHPGWQLQIDGEGATPLRVYGDFLGAVVPAGEHTVVFSFWPEELTRGLLITGAAVLLTLLYLAGTCYVGLRVEARHATADEA